MQVSGFSFFGPIKNILKNREPEMTQPVPPAQSLSRHWPQQGASYFETTVSALWRKDSFPALWSES